MPSSKGIFDVGSFSMLTEDRSLGVAKLSADEENPDLEMKSWSDVTGLTLALLTDLTKAVLPENVESVFIGAYDCKKVRADVC